MTDSEIKETLKDLLILTNSMDKEHLKKLLKILCLVLHKQEPESNFARELRKDIKKAIDVCQKNDQLEFLFTHRHIKEIYKIMGDYEWYPVCKLCGKPIKIAGVAHRHSVRYTPGEFTWDHIVPKSMGGLKELSNLQPTHKLCNNLRGNLAPQLENEHYVINITVNFISINNTKNKKIRRKAKQKLKQQLRKHYHRHNNHCHCCGR